MSVGKGGARDTHWLQERKAREHRGRDEAPGGSALALSGCTGRKPCQSRSCIHEDRQGEASAAQVRDGPDAENVPCPLRQLPACLPLAWSSISEANTGPATPTTQGEGPPHRPP